MDLLAILEDRLSFLTRFYDSAAEPFEPKMRMIEAEKEPFAPRCAPGDHDGPEYRDERMEAEKFLWMIGHCSLAYVAKALQDYLREFITREDGVTSAQINEVLPNGSGQWLDRYCRFLKTEN